MFTDDGMEAIFGETGLVRNVGFHDVNGEKDFLEDVLVRDEQGNYVMDMEKSDGISNSMPKDSEELLTFIYDRIRGASFGGSGTVRTRNNETLEDLFLYRTGESVMGWFNEIGPNAEGGIIPDYSDLVSFPKVSDGCYNDCHYCMIGGGEGVRLFSREQIYESMKKF